MASWAEAAPGPPSREAITAIVSKNSGGEMTYAKIVAAIGKAHVELPPSPAIAGLYARVDSTKMRTGRLTEQDWSKIGKAIGRLEAPLFNQIQTQYGRRGVAVVGVDSQDFASDALPVVIPREKTSRTKGQKAASVTSVNGPQRPTSAIAPARRWSRS